MKKNLIALFAFAPVLCFGDYTDLNSSSLCRLYTFKSNSSGSFPISSATPNKITTIGELFNHSLSSTFGISFNSSSGALVHPKQGTVSSIPTNKTYNVDYPVVSDSIYYCLEYACPQLYSLFSLAAHAYVDGNNFNSLRVLYTDASNTYVNFTPIDFISELLTSTNSVYRSSVIRCLSTLPDINNSLSSIDRNLIILANRPTSDFDLSTLSNRLSAAQNLGLLNEMSVDVDTALDNLNLSNYDTSSPEFPAMYDSLSRSYDRALSAIETLSGLSNISVDPSSRSNLNDLLKQFGDSLSAGGAGHFTTPLTNEMRRMSTDWVNETKAALSNNTQKIKDDLAAWKNQLHGTQTSIDNSAANIYNTLNNIAGGSSVVRVNVQNQDIGVTITDPVTIDPTQFNSFSEDLGKAGHYMESLYNEFKYWAWQSPDGWKTGFLDGFLHSLIPKVQEEVSLQHSISNLLSDFAFNYTNNTEFAISNALAGFTFSSTNDYLLLSDYADYISTSGLSDLLGFLDDDSYSDLKDELTSFGADDVSAGYGRWWRYYTGLSTIQANSVFKIANLLVDHENLLKDLKRENTDVVELSDSNVFSELLSKIPSQSHIDNKISELTNSIDQSGFARIRELIPDLTNRLSVASALYDHDFALPTDISWVLIPADSELNIKERVIHISPSEHYRVFQVLHYGIAFSYCIVNLILLPKFLLLLVRLFDRVWNKSEHLIYNSTQS